MTIVVYFKDLEPQDKQIGGKHYKSFHIQPYEFISKNNLVLPGKRCEICL